MLLFYFFSTEDNTIFLNLPSSQVITRNTFLKQFFPWNSAHVYWGNQG